MPNQFSFFLDKSNGKTTSFPTPCLTQDNLNPCRKYSLNGVVNWVHFSQHPFHPRVSQTFHVLHGLQCSPISNQTLFPPESIPRCPQNINKVPTSPLKRVHSTNLPMGFAVRVRSAGQKYGPTCHQRDRADVTEFVTLVRLSSLGQHVGVLALAGYYKRRKSAPTAGPKRKILLELTEANFF